MKPYKHMCTPENAPKMREWIASRGGVAVWPSVNLSNPGASWSTPALTAEGSPTTKPTWQADTKPAFVVTSEADIGVETMREVRRFHVATRHGRSNPVKLTDASNRKLDAALTKAGKGSSYVFDYSTQEAVILVPETTVPLSEWQPAREAKAS